MEITELLAFAQQNKASDLHLAGGKEPMARIDGGLRPIKTGDLSADTVKNMIYSVMTEEQRSEYESEKEIDFAIAFGADSRFRVNAYTTVTGPAAAFREIPTKVPSLEQLNAPSIFKQFAEIERGLVLVTGTHGLGQVHHPRRHDQSHEREYRHAHPHGRGPGGIRSSQEARPHQPPRGGQAHHVVLPRTEERAA
jgi:twitching motility protein PilT